LGFRRIEAVSNPKLAWNFNLLKNSSFESFNSEFCTKEETSALFDGYSCPKEKRIFNNPNLRGVLPLFSSVQNPSADLWFKSSAIEIRNHTLLET
jgi:hypothetical protein